jgi:hypothetical protein
VSKRVIDYTGIQFPTFKVIKYLGKTNRRNWLCLCQCGTYYRSNSGLIQANEKRSCGCLKYTGIHKNQKFDEKEAAYRAKVTSYKASATHRKLVFNLSMEQAINLLKGNCYYCGTIPLTHFSLRNKRINIHKNQNNSKILYNGFDRINNSKGYTIENTVSCCAKCNYMKLTMSKQEFLNQIQKIYHHLNTL